MIKPLLSVIIPTYNELTRIGPTLIDVHHHLSCRKDISYEIIVSDGKSTDGTQEFARRLRTLIPHLRVVETPERRLGDGDLLRNGMREAHGNIRLVMDAANSVSVDQFWRFLPYFEQGYHVVIGSRAAGVAFGNIPIRALLLPDIRDSRCKFKAFSSHVAEMVFPHTATRSAGCDIEALAVARKYGYKIKEVAVAEEKVLKQHPASLSLGNLLRIRLRLLFRLYPDAHMNRSGIA